MSLSIEKISKNFNQIPVLDDIDVYIKDCEFVAILGPSGCGKTTLLRCIAGFIKPNKGTIRIDGQVCSDDKTMVPVEKRNLGMVFQSFALWPHMTVREHIEYPLKSKRLKHISVKEKKKMLEYALDSTGLSNLSNSLTGELSGGQRQRVSLARAIVGRPSILLMDEPLSALDVALKVNMRKEIQNIHKSSKSTIVYVTHDQREAMAMADRVIIMKEGKIEQVGTPQEIYLYPETKFVSSFVGKCNFIKGKWEGDHFYVRGTSLHIFNKKVASIFKREGIYPARPEEFIIQDKGEGLDGVITNKQYYGRETQYCVTCMDENFTIYSNDKREYNVGQTIKLSLEA